MISFPLKIKKKTKNLNKQIKNYDKTKNPKTTIKKYENNPGAGAHMLTIFNFCLFILSLFQLFRNLQTTFIRNQ